VLGRGKGIAVVEGGECDAGGRAVRTLSRTPPVSGDNLRLSLDIRLQEVAEKAFGERRGALVAIGALIGSSGVKFWPIWVSASLGAAFGDWLSYWIGVKLEYTVAHIWPLSRHPDLIPRGEAFMKKWGIPGIFIGRFFGPLRASVPLIAGIFEMPFWRFQLANFSSAFVWAAVLLTLGDAITKALKWIW